MTFTTLVSVEDLARHIDDPDWVILDARFDIDNEDAAKVTYAIEHVPGARQADLADHMSGEVIAGKTARRPLPDPEVFAETLRAWGIDAGTQVVIYDSMNGIMAASRLWVMMKWAGHDTAAVLDGGYQAWVESGGVVTADVPRVTPTDYVPVFDHGLIMDLDEVQEVSSRGGALLFDSRSQTDGIPSHDAVAGRIPGSGWADRALNSTANGRWRDSAELAEHYRALVGDRDPHEVVFYCGSGVTGAQNVLGMSHAGLPGSRLYVGSWSEWILDPTRPIQPIND